MQQRSEISVVAPRSRSRLVGIVSAALCSALLLAACGQRGPLTLEGSKRNKTASNAAPTAIPPAAPAASQVAP